MSRTPSRHVANLRDRAPDVTQGGSSLTALDTASFPLLDGVSVRRVVLAAGTAMEPRWQVNADELGYCLSGTALVTIFGNQEEYQRFSLAAGQMYFVPTGVMVAVENVGDTDCEILAAHTSGDPRQIGLRAGLAAFSDAVVGNTLDVDEAVLAHRTHAVVDEVFVEVASRATLTADDERPSAYKFDVEAMAAPVATASGTAKTARKQFWPALTHISMYSLTVSDEGMREIHWHPFTVEVGYLAKGRARMSILDPDGTFDTYVLEVGDVYVVPRAYPHQIEDLTDDGDIHMLIFFDQPTPADIGYRAALSTLRPGLVAALMSLPVDDVVTFPFFPSDPLLVERVNPVDA
ncbi:cupin domain-containing protein [Jatrophihabitans sp. YIM 134969]